MLPSLQARTSARRLALEFTDTMALVGRAQAGDANARDELFARYLPRVRTIVAMRLGRPLAAVVEVDDLVQQTMLRVLKGLDGFEPRSEPGFYHWVSQLVANELADQWRRSGAVKRGGGRVVELGSYDTSLLANLLGPTAGPTPSQAFDAGELGARLESAMLSLSERDREAIVLRELCELSYAEIAALLGLGAESSARALVARAKARLAEKLG